MHLLQNADASLENESQSAKEKPQLFCSCALLFLKRKVNKENQDENDAKLREAERFSEENARHGGNDHRRRSNQKSYMHRP